MAIKIAGTEVISDSRGLNNIASVDATTVASLSAAGVGAGGGVVEATASGAIADGDPVVINSDGTVSIVGNVFFPVGGTPVEFSSLASPFISGAYDSNSNKVLFLYQSNGARVVVGTVSGTSISFGTSIEAFSANPTETSVTFDSNANKFALFSRDSNGITNVKVATISGTDVTVGGLTTISDTRYIASTFDSNSNKIVFVYQGAGGDDPGDARVGTISGTSISFGSAVQFEPFFNYFTSVTFDSNSNKVVVAFRRADGANSKAIVGTVSGTSISFGSAVTFDTSSSPGMFISFDSNSNKVLISYKNSSDSKGYAIVGTVSGTSISFGTPAVFESTAINSDSIRTAFDSVSNKVIICYTFNSNSDNNGFFTAATISGTSVSFETSTSINEQGGFPVIDDEGQVVIGYSDYGTDSGKGKAVVYNVNSTDADKFIGMSDGSYSNAAAATIQVTGSVNEAQTGLTAGEKYYVVSGGNLSTTPDIRQAYAGIALSATKILVKG